MSGGRGLGEMAVQAACALAEVFFPEDAAGETAVPLDQAHLIASGRLDLWDGWESQPPDMKALVGQFLRLRHNELASRNAFLAAARRQFATPDATFTLPAGVPSYEATRVLPGTAVIQSRLSCRFWRTWRTFTLALGLRSRQRHLGSGLSDGGRKALSIFLKRCATPRATRHCLW